MNNKRKNGSMQRRVELVNNSDGRRRNDDIPRSAGAGRGYGSDRYSRRPSGGGSGSGSRRVSREDRSGSVYYVRGSERRHDTGRETTPERRGQIKRPLTEADMHRRIEQTRKRYRRRVKSIRAALVLAAAAAAAVILIFMTPIFNIRQIALEGNNSVTKEQIEEKVGSLIGENLFSVTGSRIRGMVMEIPQVESVDVAKKLFPPSVTLTITETYPAAYLLSGNSTIVIDADMKVIGDSGTFSTDGIPSISGISIPSYEMNKQIVSDSSEKDETLRIMLSSFESTGLLGDITYISLDDMSDIKFNYANRLECSCGSSLEMERKIRMFAETIASSSMDANSMGTIDLSTPGQAVYQP